jgi:uncharacterized membrane protein
VIRLVLLWLTLLTAPLRAEVYPALHKVTGVAADDMLNIRAAPDAAAEVIGTLAADATGVEVLAEVDGWGLVNTGDRSGYVAMRFLTRTDGPDWNALEPPLTCLGTEPFWTLQIDAKAGETRFQTPEDEEARIAPITASWPALPWSQSAAIALPDGIAVLAPAECSDGMSDRAYGIAADLFLTGPDRTRLSGCCRLDPP